MSKEFNFKLFDNLCQLPEVITQEDIAKCMDVSVDTCTRKVEEASPGDTFAGYRRRQQSRFRVNLVNKQIEVALKGNVVMLKWLGVNYLGQSETPKPINPGGSDSKLIIDLSGESFRGKDGT